MTTNETIDHYNAPSNQVNRGLVQWVGSLRYLGSEVGRAADDVGAGIGHLLARVATAVVSLAVFCLVAVTATAGYWASFIGLHLFAMIRMGYDPLHAWLVPVAIDGAALGLTISATVLAWKRTAAPLISLLIVGFTSVSSWINFEHISDPVGRQAAAFLPFAAVVLLEVLLGLLRRLRGDQPHGAITRALNAVRQILAETAPDEAATGYLILRALLHPIRAWRLVRSTFTLPQAQEKTHPPATAVAPSSPTRVASAEAKDTTRAPARALALTSASDDIVQVREAARAWIKGEHAAGREPTGLQVGEKFDRTDRWGRTQLDAVRSVS